MKIPDIKAIGIGKSSFAFIALALVIALPGCEKVSELVFQNRPNILLITLDTTRADRIGCYGYRGIETPVLDKLAAEGVRFDRAYASSPITLPNHATILTGTYTLFHGARNNGTFQVDPSITTGAEMFKEAGYNTAAFIASFPLLARFGLDQGFDIYDDRIEEGKEKRTFMFQERRAEDVNEAVFRWLGKKPEGPFFMWVHYFDPHFPYQAPSPYRERYFSNPYNGEIAYMDSQIGKLLERLEQLGLLENTIVAVTADHGESHGEHGEKTHAILIYYGTIRVPFIIWKPGIIPANKVIEKTVSSIDVLPTLLDYAGVEPHEDIQGISLKELVEGKAENLDLVAYSETMAPFLHFNWSPLESIRSKGYLYIKAEPEELYDINADPKELKDLSESEPKKLAQMRELFNKTRKSIVNPNELQSEVKLDAETQERLRALGYIFGSTVEPKADEKLKNPRFMVHILEKYFRGQSAIANEKYEKAIDIFNTILEDEPNFGRAILEKGLAYYRLKEYEKAIEQYTLAEKLLPSQAELYSGRAQCYLNLGKVEEAEKNFLKVISIDSSKSNAYVMLARIKFRRKEIKAAHELLLKAVEANYKSEIAHMELAQLYRLLGEVDDAKHEFLQAKNANPNFVLPAYLLGKLHYEYKEYDYAIANFEEALKRDPKFVPAHVMLAQIYIHDDHLKKAQSHLDVAMALRDDYDGTYFTYGNLLAKQGKLQDAYKQFLKAVELNPKNALAHKNLGAAYAMFGVPDKAIEHYKISLKLMPNQPQAEKMKAALIELEKPAEATKNNPRPITPPMQLKQ